ncbi:hypothetical protein [Rugosimonospora africana]|nr:hypothetical protein [Rugosimonospora africana]
MAHAGRTVTVETSGNTFRVYDGPELLTEVARTTTRPIARFKVRNPNRHASSIRHNDPMPLDEHELWHVLHALDDPDHLERPAGFDNHRARIRFDQLVQRLNVYFDGHCQADGSIQDASLYGRINIPATATATGRPLVASISNFGPLAVLSVDNPGVWSDNEAAQLLHPDDAHHVHTALADLHYIRIPEQPLREPYDGVYDPAILGPSEATWWIRYFDYL